MDARPSTSSLIVCAKRLIAHGRSSVTGRPPIQHTPKTPRLTRRAKGLRSGSKRFSIVLQSGTKPCCPGTRTIRTIAPSPLPQEAICTSTGVGKTRIAARIIAMRTKLAVYAVPRHQLGEEVADVFRWHGVTAAQWRGRKAFVSGKSGPKMCGNLEAVKVAEEIGATVETACCKGKDNFGVTVKCPLYETCEY